VARADAELEPVAEPVPAPPDGNGTSPRTPFKARLPQRKERRVKSPKLKPSYQRSYRQTVQRVDLWSVLKISICFYLTALIVLLCSGIVLWWIASAVGIISNIENFAGDLVNSNDFQFLSWSVLRASALVGLVVVSLMVVCTVLAAASYNLFASVLGGIEITVVEEESVTRK
jgi:hypothetical protein